MDNRIRVVLSAFLAAIVPACGGGGGSGGGTSTVSLDVRPTLGSLIHSGAATIGPAGGTLSWPASVDPTSGDSIAAGYLTVPAGALSQNTPLGVEIRTASGNALSDTIVYRFTPDGLQFATPATLLYGYTNTWVSANSIDETRTGSLTGDDGLGVEGMAVVQRDAAANTLLCQVQHFSLCWETAGDQDSANYALFHQPYGLWTKSGQALVTPSLDKVAGLFWTSPRVAVVVHGLMSTPGAFQSSDLGVELEARYGTDNVAYFSYPSSRSVWDNGLLLKSALRHRTSGDVDIYSHSMGGLVSRAFLELHDGSNGRVKRLITFGTPHQGVSLLASTLDGIQVALYGLTLISGQNCLAIQGVQDLATNSGFLNTLNAPRFGTYANSGTPQYFVVVADSDSVVPDDASEGGDQVLDRAGLFYADTALLDPVLGHSIIYSQSHTVMGDTGAPYVSVTQKVREWNGYGGNIGGIVTGPGGSPVSGAAVTANGLELRSILTDSNGNYSLVGLLVSAPAYSFGYSVQVSKSGYDTATLNGVWVYGGTFTSLDVQLALQSPTDGTLQGTVTDSVSGSPLGSASVNLTGPETANTTTLANGTYSIPSLMPGSYTATFSRSGYAPTSIGVTISSGGTTIQNASLVAATGTIISQFAAPASNTTGIAFDGTYIWIGDKTTDSVYKLNASTGAVVSTYNAPAGNIRGLVFYAGYLYCSDLVTKGVYRIDPANGSFISLFTASSVGEPMGLAYNGTYFFISDDTTGGVYRYTSGGSLSTSFTAPGGAASNPRGIAWDGSALRLAEQSSGKIRRIDIGGNLLSDFDSPVGGPGAVGWDGTHIRVCADSGATIYRVVP